jgi:hypothetical protein
MDIDAVALKKKLKAGQLDDLIRMLDEKLLEEEGGEEGDESMMGQKGMPIVKKKVSISKSMDPEEGEVEEELEEDSIDSEGMEKEELEEDEDEFIDSKEEKMYDDESKDKKNLSPEEDAKLMDELKSFLSGDRFRREERIKTVYSDDLEDYEDREVKKDREMSRSKDREMKSKARMKRAAY